MSNLILPFIFCSLILLLTQLCKTKGFLERFFSVISIVCGITYLGNLCYLDMNNLGIEHSYRVYFIIQILNYIFLKIFSLDQTNTVVVNINKNGSERVKVS